MENYTYNEKIKSIVFRKYNIFAAFKQSDYITLIDESGNPVTITIDGRKHFFTFYKHHKSINICNNKGDFSFYEKLYIANCLKQKTKWVNLSLWRLKIALKRYVAVEPRHLFLKVDSSDVTFKVLSTKDKIIIAIIIILLF